MDISLKKTKQHSLFEKAEVLSAGSYHSPHATHCSAGDFEERAYSQKDHDATQCFLSGRFSKLFLATPPCRLLSWKRQCIVVQYKQLGCCVGCAPPTEVESSFFLLLIFLILIFLIKIMFYIK